MGDLPVEKDNITETCEVFIGGTGKKM